MSTTAFRQIIEECIKRDVDCALPGPVLDDVLHERFPLASGGVGHAHRKLHAKIRQEIIAFYERPDWSPEPTCTWESPL